eukprot:COSAG02_NODE_57725_length_279_cov_1.433333_1_plen_26_part_01
MHPVAGNKGERDGEWIPFEPLGSPHA